METKPSEIINGPTMADFVPGRDFYVVTNSLKMQ